MCSLSRARRGSENLHFLKFCLCAAILRLGCHEKRCRLQICPSRFRAVLPESPAGLQFCESAVMQICPSRTADSHELAQQKFSFILCQHHGSLDLIVLISGSLVAHICTWADLRICESAILSICETVAFGRQNQRFQVSCVGNLRICESVNL